MSLTAKRSPITKCAEAPVLHRRKASTRCDQSICSAVSDAVSVCAAPISHNNVSDTVGAY